MHIFAALLGFTELYNKFQLIVPLFEPQVDRFGSFSLFCCIFLVTGDSPFLLKKTAHYLFSTKQQTDTVKDQLVNILEHLAAKELSISFRSS